MSAVLYYVNGDECDAATFLNATEHLEYKHAQHHYREHGELHNFADGSTVEFENVVETNHCGFKRDVRVWSFTTNKKGKKDIMKLTKSQRIEELGAIGEHLVRVLCSQSVISQNKYDSEKDLICDDKHVEVKTQIRHFKENCFTIHPNHLKKCTQVDYLIFVEYPARGKGNVINIWNCKDQFDIREISRESGSRCFAYDCDKLENIAKIDSEMLANKMRALSTSTFS